MIRVEAMWLCTEPMYMRAGTDTTLARVVKVFGAARHHHAYVFANKRSTRLKVLVHDGRRLTVEMLRPTMQAMRWMRMAWNKAAAGEPLAHDVGIQAVREGQGRNRRTGLSAL